MQRGAAASPDRHRGLVGLDSSLTQSYSDVDKLIAMSDSLALQHARPGNRRCSVHIRTQIAVGVDYSIYMIYTEARDRERRDGASADC